MREEIAGLLVLNFGRETHGLDVGDHGERRKFHRCVVWDSSHQNKTPELILSEVEDETPRDVDLLPSIQRQEWTA